MHGAISCLYVTYYYYYGYPSAIVCATGTYLTGSSCVSCAAGQYQPLTGQTACDSCPAGQYSAAAGAEACWSCPAGNYAAAARATACTSCASGYYSAGAASACSASCSTGSAVAQACVAFVADPWDLQLALLTDGASVRITADIFLTSTISVSYVTGVIIDGQGLYKIDGQSTHQCLRIWSAQVTFKGLTIAMGYTPSVRKYHS